MSRVASIWNQRLFLGITIVLVWWASSIAQTPVHRDVLGAREKFAGEWESALTPVIKRYRTRLEALEKSFRQKGDSAAAEQVKGELTWLDSQATLFPSAQAITGEWSVRYSNGALRTYSVLADSTVVWMDGSTKRAGKLAPEDGSFVLEFGDGKVERLAIRPALIIDHFSTKALFQSGGAPDFSALGEKAAPR